MQPKPSCQQSTIRKVLVVGADTSACLPCASAMLVAKEASSHLMLRASLQGEHCCCPHSIRQETEAHRSHTSRKQHVLSCIWLFVIPWTVACQAPLSMEFSRQEYWSGVPFPSPGDRPNSGIEPRLLCLLHWQADSLPLNHLGSLATVEQTLYVECDDVLNIKHPL